MTYSTWPASLQCTHTQTCYRDQKRTHTVIIRSDSGCIWVCLCVRGYMRGCEWCLTHLCRFSTSSSCIPWSALCGDVYRTMNVYELFRALIRRWSWYKGAITWLRWLNFFCQNSHKACPFSAARRRPWPLTHVTQTGSAPSDQHLNQSKWVKHVFSYLPVHSLIIRSESPSITLLMFSVPFGIMLDTYIIMTEEHIYVDV